MLRIRKNFLKNGYAYSILFGETRNFCIDKIGRAIATAACEIGAEPALIYLVSKFKN